MSDPRPFGSTVKRHWTELETPALLIDVDVAQRNIEYMAARAAEMDVAVRPHFKAHKCLALARLQVEAGATGITVATANEALALIEADFNNVLIANQLVQSIQIDALAKVSSSAQITVLVDEPANLKAISAAACAAGGEIGVMIDVDTGMGRCGVRRREDGYELAGLAESLPGIRFDGLSAYEGHCAGIEDRRQRAAQTREAIEAAAEFVDAVDREGIEVPAVSAGGTTTYSIAGADPRVTEVQPGVYAVMDVARRRFLSEFEIALAVAATVISRKGSRFVLDCGHKAVNSRYSPPQLTDGIGEIVAVDEEHLRCDAFGPEPQVGKSVQVVPGDGPLTINLYDRFHAISDGIVVDEWPVTARR
ncbi:MAG TPA: alanine racemase [Solirubrobacterales bacterium]|nr:alanine racemase [Solirubrobacterales bacterium]